MISEKHVRESHQEGVKNMIVGRVIERQSHIKRSRCILKKRVRLVVAHWLRNEQNSQAERNYSQETQANPIGARNRRNGGIQISRESHRVSARFLCNLINPP